MTISLTNIFYKTFENNKTHYFMEYKKISCSKCKYISEHFFYLHYDTYINEKINVFCYECSKKINIKDGQLIKINFVEQIPENSNILTLNKPEKQKMKGDITIYDVHKLDCKKTIDRTKYKYESFEGMQIGISEQELQKIEDKRLKNLEIETFK